MDGWIVGQAIYPFLEFRSGAFFYGDLVCFLLDIRPIFIYPRLNLPGIDEIK